MITDACGCQRFDQWWFWTFVKTDLLATRWFEPDVLLHIFRAISCLLERWLDVWLRLNFAFIVLYILHSLFLLLLQFLFLVLEKLFKQLAEHLLLGIVIIFLLVQLVHLSHSYLLLDTSKIELTFLQQSRFFIGILNGFYKLAITVFDRNCWLLGRTWRLVTLKLVRLRIHYRCCLWRSLHLVMILLACSIWPCKLISAESWTFRLVCWGLGWLWHFCFRIAST